MENMMDIDHTLFIQLINFIITIIVLNYLLIKPVRNQIAARKSLFDKLASEIDSFSNQSNNKLTDYENALAKTRATALEKRDALRNSGLQVEQQLLAEAQEKAQNYLMATREDIAKEAQQAIKRLYEEVDGFANRVVAKIL